MRERPQFTFGVHFKLHPNPITGYKSMKFNNQFVGPISTVQFMKNNSGTSHMIAAAFAWDDMSEFDKFIHFCLDKPAMYAKINKTDTKPHKYIASINWAIISDIESHLRRVHPRPTSSLIWLPHLQTLCHHLHNLNLY